MHVRKYQHSKLVNWPVTVVALESINSETGGGAGGAAGGGDESIPVCCVTSVPSYCSVFFRQPILADHRTW